MLARLWCWLFECKTLLEVYTGKTIKRTNRLTNNVDIVPLCILEQKKYCVRCGKPNKYYKKEAQ